MNRKVWCRMGTKCYSEDSVKLKAAKAGMEVVQSGISKQVLFGMAAQMRVSKKDHLVEVRADNNPWGLEEGWVEVGALLGWISKEMQNG